MIIDMNNFGMTKDYELDFCQKEVDGGKITIAQIDKIKESPEAESIIISGLRQDTFEYFVHNFGKQFKAISFFKNKNVSDWSALAELEDIEYIHFFYNQKITSLWNMEKNVKLKGLGIYDFSKLRSIEGIEKAKNLEYFGLGNAAWSKMTIESLQPLTESNITHFEWTGDKVLDGDYLCLANSKIKILDMNPCKFTMEELAELLIALPDDLQGSITVPYTVGAVMDVSGNRTTFKFLCKGKNRCVEGVDDERFQQYLSEFDALIEPYRSEKKKKGFLGSLFSFGKKEKEKK